MTEPTAWALHNSRNPEFNEVEFAHPYREPLTEGDMKAGWTATPLFTREAAAAEERARIIGIINGRIDIANGFINGCMDHEVEPAAGIFGGLVELRSLLREVDR